VSQAGAKLPDDSADPVSGSSQTGNVGDLFAPFFRVQFKNVSKEQVANQRNQDQFDIDQINDALALVPGADPLAGATNVSALGSIISNLGSSDFSEQESLVPGDDSFALDSRLLQNIAANLKIESKAGSPLKFTLVLTPPYDDGIRLLNNKLLNFGTLVKVQWGYAGWGGATILSDVYVFRNNYPQAQFGEDISITVSGHDLTYSVGSRNTGRRNWLFKEYKNDCEIVAEIVGRTQTLLDISAVPEDSTFLTGANRPVEEGPPAPPGGVMQQVTDWALIRRLCRDHSLTFTSSSNTFRIFSLHDSSKDNTYSYRFLYRQAPEGPNDIPVMNINGNLQPWVFLPVSGRGLVSYKYDPDADGDDKSSMVEDTGADSDKPLLGPGSGEPGKTTGNSPEDAGILFDKGSGVSEPDEEIGPTTPSPANEKDKDLPNVLSTPAKGHNANQKAAAVVKEAQTFSHPKVGVTAPGVVDMWPGVVVQLEGTSVLFDGPYYVLNATHTIGNSGYDMQLELMRLTVKGHDVKKPKDVRSPTTGAGGGDATASAIEEEKLDLQKDQVLNLGN